MAAPRCRTASAASVAIPPAPPAEVNIAKRARQATPTTSGNLSRSIGRSSDAKTNRLAVPTQPPSAAPTFSRKHSLGHVMTNLGAPFVSLASYMTQGRTSPSGTGRIWQALAASQIAPNALATAAGLWPYFRAWIPHDTDASAFTSGQRQARRGYDALVHRRFRTSRKCCAPRFRLDHQLGRRVRGSMARRANGKAPDTSPASIIAAQWSSGSFQLHSRVAAPHAAPASTSAPGDAREPGRA